MYEYKVSLNLVIGVVSKTVTPVIPILTAGLLAIVLLNSAVITTTSSNL